MRPQATSVCGLTLLRRGSGRQRRVGGGSVMTNEAVVHNVYVHVTAILECAGEELACHRRLQFLAHSALERPCAIDGVVANLSKVVERSIAAAHVDALVDEPL
eukprot:27653_2